ncbi:hypothetical protein ACEPPN_000406 [Leptodophora sp. 'Broadleaf-Isolate-01']
MLKGLTFRAGYLVPTGAYAIRRGAINAMDGNVTTGTKGLVLGHQRPQITQQYYLNKHADVDLQNLFVNRSAPSQRAHAEKLRTMGSQRLIGAPIDLRGTDQYNDLLQTPSYLALRQKWQHLKTIMASKEDIKRAKVLMDGEIAGLRREGG